MYGIYTYFPHSYPPTIEYGDSGKKFITGKFCSIAKGLRVYLGGNHNTTWVTTYPFGQQEFAFDGTGHPSTKGDVIIGNDVWIADNVTIMSGVTIGDGAVIANNSHVVKDVEPYSLVGGNPARFIRYRFQKDQIDKLLQIRWWDWPLDKINKNLPLLCSENIDEFIKVNYSVNRFDEFYLNVDEKCKWHLHYFDRVISVDKTHNDKKSLLNIEKDTKIHVWQGERYDGKLNFMYKPFMHTVVEGFKSLNIDVNSKVGYYNWDDIKPGDIFIWIGIVHLDIVPWEILKTRGVYNIYYNTDAIPINIDHCYEIWDYSWKNIETNYVSDKIIRYVPTGFIGNRHLIDHEGKRDIKLTMFGLRKGSGWDELTHSLNNQIHMEYEIWNEKALNDFMNRSYVSIFVSIPHNTGYSSFESSRCSNIFSCKGILISAGYYGKDEEEFKDIVDFVELNQIADKFNEYLRMDPAELNKIAQERYEKYKAKFSPQEIFKVAKI